MSAIPEAVKIADRAASAAYALCNGPIPPMHAVWAKHAYDAATTAIADLEAFRARMQHYNTLMETDDV
jgi:hypothetical protein